MHGERVLIITTPNVSGAASGAAGAVHTTLNDAVGLSVAAVCVNAARSGHASDWYAPPLGTANEPALAVSSTPLKSGPVAVIVNWPPSCRRRTQAGENRQKNKCAPAHDDSTAPRRKRPANSSETAHSTCWPSAQRPDTLSASLP